MLYAIFSILFIGFLLFSFWLYKYLLRMKDPMKFLFFVMVYIGLILIVFGGAGYLAEKIFNPMSITEFKFMVLVYLLSTICGFFNIAIIAVKKLRKK